MLAEVDLYKVGHHGSLNATPKTLWEPLQEPRNQKPARPAADVDDGGQARQRGQQDRSPAAPLVEALKGETEFLTTQAFKEELYKDTRLAF